MALATSLADRQPLGEINTTPLIDVMLVLLIMFVITIPAETHSLEVPLPAEGRPDLEIRERNQIVVTSGDSVLWNSAEVSLAQLATLLVASARMPKEPELQFAPDATASYGRSAEVLRLIKTSGVTAFGFVGNERFAEFGVAPRR